MKNNRDFSGRSVTYMPIPVILSFFVSLHASINALLGRTAHLEFLQILAERVRKLREEERLTQEEMAEILGCTLKQYQKIELGKVDVPISTLAILSDHFSVTADYLLGHSSYRN